MSTICEKMVSLDDNDFLQYLQEIEAKGEHQEVLQMDVVDLYDDDEFEGRDVGGPNTTLQLAFYAEKSTKVLHKLIELGGKELVMLKNFLGFNALQYACERVNPNFDVIRKMVEVGGHELLLIKDSICETVLHRLCQKNDVSTNIIIHIIEMGGKRLVMEKNLDGETALHYLSQNKYASIEIASKLIEVGGCELLMEMDEDGDTALHSSYFSEYSTNEYDDIFILMVKEGIVHKAGGEFSLGGLFDATRQQAQDEIFDQWDAIFPYLQTAIIQVMQEQQAEPPPPILQAAILARAPLNVLQNIIDHFNCISTTDSFNRYPIDLAVALGIQWDDGMKQIVEATAEAQQRSVINVAAQYGLKWKNHMRELVELNKAEVISASDDLTGLSLFMLCAAGHSHDLSAIFEILRMNPEHSTLVERKLNCLLSDKEIKD